MPIAPCIEEELNISEGWMYLKFFRMGAWYGSIELNRIWPEVTHRWHLCTKFPQT